MTKAKLYLALQAAVCVALAALLAASAIGIYREGMARRAEDPLAAIYTPEIVREKLAPIAPLLIASAALLAAGLALGIRDGRPGSAKDFLLVRDAMAARVATPSEAMVRERRLQRRLAWIGRGAFAGCMIPAILWLANPDHFPLDDLEGMFAGLLRGILPWTALGLGALAVTAALRERSARREVEAAAIRLKEERRQGVRPEPPAGKPAQRTGALRAILSLAALALIVAGIFNGSAGDVLYKAINICTECIGLG